jgi:hypothetical protein
MCVAKLITRLYLMALVMLITMHFSLDDISVILMPHNSRAKADFVIHSPTTLHFRRWPVGAHSTNSRHT